LNILITENASEIWMVSGRPSGIATTTRTTKRLKFFGRDSNNLPAGVVISSVALDPSYLPRVGSIDALTKLIIRRTTKITKHEIRL